MSDYDNTNRGALFPTADRALIRQGQVHFGPTAEDIAVVKATTKTGKTIFEVYQKIGAVFANIDKKTEKAPDMSGKVSYSGVEYQMAGWAQTSQNGLKYTSVAVTPPEDQPEQQEGPSEEDRYGDLDDEIPF